MKKGDTVLIKVEGGRIITSTCLAIYGGVCYIGNQFEVLLSGVIWELLNKGSIQLV